MGANWPLLLQSLTYFVLPPASGDTEGFHQMRALCLGLLNLQNYKNK